MSQVDSRGNLRHLLTLDGLDARLLETILDRAQGFCRPPDQPAARSNALRGRTIANLFFEPSTRTRASFDLAGKRLGADVLNLDVRMSSRAKGESILDTIYTLQAMHSDIFVVRDAEPGVPAMIAANVAPHVCVLNAGESDLAHPTQGLLDVLTIRQHKPDIPSLTVAIIGDIRHSRVARSTSQALATLGLKRLRLISHGTLAPDPADFPGAEVCDDLERGIADADVVMALRIQKERMKAADLPDPAAYHARYGLTEARMAGARPDAIVMHPGPMNRDVEIAGDLADGPRSVIVAQVANGVAVRMAVMEMVMETVHGG